MRISSNIFHENNFHLYYKRERLISTQYLILFIFYNIFNTIMIHLWNKSEIYLFLITPYLTEYKIPLIYHWRNKFWAVNIISNDYKNNKPSIKDGFFNLSIVSFFRQFYRKHRRITLWLNQIQQQTFQLMIWKH